MEHAAQCRMRQQAAILAILALALSVICVVLAFAWRGEHQRAECWRAAFEDDEVPAGGRC